MLRIGLVCEIFVSSSSKINVTGIFESSSNPSGFNSFNTSKQDSESTKVDNPPDVSFIKQ